MTTIATRDFRGFLLSEIISFINTRAKEYAKDIIEGMRNKKIKGKRIIVEKAKKPKFKNKKIR